MQTPGIVECFQGWKGLGEESRLHLFGDLEFVKRRGVRTRAVAAVARRCASTAWVISSKLTRAKEFLSISSKRVNTPPQTGDLFTQQQRGRAVRQVVCALLILDTPETRNMTKANSALSPLTVGRHDIFRHKGDRRGLADQLVLIRVGFRRDQRKHGGAVRRRNSYPALSGLKAHIKGQVEAELIHVEPQASVLIADENIDRVHAEVGIVAIQR